MASHELNRLTTELRDFCAEHVLKEKWLLAPARRIGYQWLETVTLSGQPVLNLRVKTLLAAALELAAPEMERMGVTLLHGVRAEVIAGRVFEGMSKKGKGYLSNLDPSPGLFRTILGALRDLRMAGLTSEMIDAGSFEVMSKGREIAVLLREYEKELNSEGLVDHAGVLRLAIGRLQANPSPLPQDSYLLLPEDMLEGLQKLERDLWDSIHETNFKVLNVDPDPETQKDKVTDASLLRWVSDPASAPQPLKDGTAKMFRAIGEVNEVREILRRCVEERISLDDVEIVHTDASTYLPLLYELSFRLAPEAGETIPVTFYEGIPTRYSRPARALMGWLSWIREGYPQSTLVRMVQDGLLRLDPAREKGLSFSRLGAILRAIPVGSGRERYIPAMEARIWGLEKQLERDEEEADENGPSPHRRELLVERLEGLRALRDLVAAVLEYQPGGSGRELLSRAARFLTETVRCVNQMDEYSRERLLEEIWEFADCIDEKDLAGLDVREWLADLPRSAQVGGQGPRPGCLFVSPLRSGGHSGRKHTFIIGLDDSRFPGPGLQDPLILDAERDGLSEDLPTAARHLSRSLEEFSRLLSRLRGEVTLSYCCRDLGDDRDMFPSPVALSSFRVLSGNHQGDQEDLLKWLPSPVSFAPQRPGDCIDITEWWLWRLCGDKAVEDPVGTIAASFPHLGRGLYARGERESKRFTIYDGFVPEAGEDHDPTRPGGPVLSASRLEKLGSCPMEYFFQYVLDIEPPEEFEFDPTAWLDPAEKGGLMHVVFRDFMHKLREDDRLPEYERDWDLLKEVLDKEVAAWKAEKPPPNREVYEREVNDLRRTARIFLQEEETYCRGSHPLYFEAAIGLAPEGEGNPIDSPEPVEIELPDGKIIRARGRIDRVDVVPGSGEKHFTVCDYKTGSSRRFDRMDPFLQGRRVQHVLYMALAQSCLAQCHPGAEVTVFGYFFPSTSEHGERLQWGTERLAEGTGILYRLCEMLANGCFPFTDDTADVTYSDYQAAFGDMDTAAKAVGKKMQNPENQALRSFKELRGYEDDSG